MIVTIKEEDPNQPEAIRLMDELSSTLKNITGDNGKSHFNLNDIKVPRFVFIIARDSKGKAVGCGALRPISENTCEIKRMYTRTKNTGLGTRILFYLEKRAKELNYQIIWLETRLVNQPAVRFYEKNGYTRIRNYGHYMDRPESVCFEKRLVNRE